MPVRAMAYYRSISSTLIRCLFRATLVLSLPPPRQNQSRCRTLLSDRPPCATPSRLKCYLGAFTLNHADAVSCCAP